MKKFYSIIICAIFACVSVNAETLAKCMLMHQGSATLFDNDKLFDAILQSENGDTIYLTDGYYPGFILEKEVTIKGAGQGTVIGSDVKIKISTSDELHQTILQDMYIKGNVELQSSMNGFKMTRCNIFYFTVSSLNDNIQLDRCQIRDGFYQSSNIKGCNVMNSKIKMLHSSEKPSGSCNFVNCNIHTLYNNKPGAVQANVISSIIMNYKDDICNSIFKNCLYNSLGLDISSTMDSCWQIENPNLLDASTMECALDEAGLFNGNYIGADGTIVGVYGGKNPFSLIPNIPKVTESIVTVDNDKMKLNVSLKVTAN